MTAGRSRLGYLLLTVALCPTPAASTQLPAEPRAPQPTRERAPQPTRERAPAAAAGEVEAEARAIFARAVETQLAAQKGDPADADALLRRAAADYRRVLELRPGTAAALYNLGRALRDLGDLEGAARSYALAAESPGAKRVYYLQQWADFLRELGREDDALRAYEQVALVEPRLEEPYERVRRAYLALRDQEPERLLGFLWRLVEARQASRGAELALDALEADWTRWQRPELLAAVAASFAQMRAVPEDLLASPAALRLQRFAEEPGIGTGVTQLLGLYRSPGRYATGFDWWNQAYDAWADERGVPRRDAFGAALRALGDGLRERGDDELAAACYGTAVDLGGVPDPLALRSLATLYVERNDLEAVDRLAREYADPAGSMFAAKNRAYQLGQLDQVLEYHRALGQIYGALAASGKAEWGNILWPSTALFQLDRAYQVARRLDVEAGGPETTKTTRVDPGLTALYAQGLEATGKADRGLEVRLEAMRRYEEVGDADAKRKVLQGISFERLSPEQIHRIERYQPKVDEPAPAAPPAAAASAATAVLPAGATIVATTRAIEPAAPATSSAFVTGRLAEVATLAEATPTPPRPAVEVVVAAWVEWVDTGVDVTAKNRVAIAATGIWSTAGPPSQGPAGFVKYQRPGLIVPGAQPAALVGRIGEASFLVGERFVGRVSAEGRLYLSINDVAGGFEDNQGTMLVTIRVY